MGGGGHGGYGGGGNKRKGQSNDPECRLDYVVSKPLFDLLSIQISENKTILSEYLMIIFLL
jgi:hypothetical protein